MRNAGLDILRFIAVALVIWGHSAKGVGELGPIARAFKVGGWTGVDLFFVLSGFLVAGLLFSEAQKHGSLDVSRFLIRRGFKIYPAFYVLFAFTVIVPTLQGLALIPRRTIAEALFLQSYIHGHWDHTWSLSVEEHFYFLLAAALAVGWHLKGEAAFRYIPAVCLSLSVACLLLRWLASLTAAPDVVPLHALNTHTRLDSLAFGVLLSYLWHYRSLAERLQHIPSWLFIVVGCGLLAPAFIYPAIPYTWMMVQGYTLCYLGAGALLLAAVRVRTVRAAPLRGIVFLGSYSYSIYLWHWPYRLWGMNALGKRWPLLADELYLPTYILGSLVLGVLMGKLVEMPALRIRDKYFPTRSRQSPPAIAATVATQS